MFKKNNWLRWVGLLFLLARCTLGEAEPAPATLSVVSTPTITPSPTLPTSLVTPPPDLVTLTLWIPDIFNPYAEGSGAALLLTQLEAFTQANPGIQVQVLVKKADGAGGLYHLLSTATAAAPTVLPDLVLLGETELAQAVHNELVKPWPAAPAAGELAAEAFFPFAWQGSQVAGQRYGLPYLAQLEQTVYRVQKQAAPPLSWNDVLTGSYQLLFPVVPSGGLAAEALLSIYLGSEGVVMDEHGAPLLDRVHLEELYRFFAALGEAGKLEIAQGGALADTKACWLAYQEGRGTLSVVPAGDYWALRPSHSQAAWLPTRDGKPVALAHLWTLVLVTGDPFRQAAALKLADWLTAPEQSAALAQATMLLPVQRAALTYWTLTPEETVLLETLLTVAQLPPPPEVAQPVRRALQSGLSALLQGQATTPEEAATQALTMLRR